MQNPQFAYLPACRTTVDDKEDVTLASRRGNAVGWLRGVTFVIGTTWTADDQ